MDTLIKTFKKVNNMFKAERRIGMLNSLAKNQYVKICKCDDSVEYGIVLNNQNNTYDIMSIGFENKNGNFLEYPPNVDKLVQNYSISDAQFDEVKKNEIRRKMNIWMENHYKS